MNPENSKTLSAWKRGDTISSGKRLEKLVLQGLAIPLLKHQRLGVPRDIFSILEDLSAALSAKQVTLCINRNQQPLGLVISSRICPDILDAIVALRGAYALRPHEWGEGDIVYVHDIFALPEDFPCIVEFFLRELPPSVDVFYARSKSNRFVVKAATASRLLSRLERAAKIQHQFSMELGALRTLENHCFEATQFGNAKLV